MLQPSGCRPLPSFSPLLGLVPSVASVLPIALVALVAPVTLVACDRVSEPASIGAVPLDAAYLTFVLIPPPGDEDEARWLVGRRFELTGTSLRFSESGPGYRTSGLIQPDLTVACVVDPERQLEQSFGHLRSENSLAPFVIVAQASAGVAGMRDPTVPPPGGAPPKAAVPASTRPATDEG